MGVNFRWLPNPSNSAPAEVTPPGQVVPIKGTVTTPAADIGQRTVNTGAQGAIVALVVGGLGLVGVHLSPGSVAALMVILLPLATFVWHLFKRKPKA